MWEDGMIALNGGKYGYSAKVYDLGSGYGIDGGRISKLYVFEDGTDREIVTYDREWILPKRRPKDGTEAGDVLAAILKMFPDRAKERQNHE